MRGWKVMNGMAVAVAVAVLGGCGNDEGPEPITERESPDPEPAAEVEEAAEEETGEELSVPEAMQAFEDDGDVLEVTIEGDDRMRFNIDRFEVEPGQMVRLTLDHVGNLPAQSMGHNVVIVGQGEDPVDFGSDANAEGADHDNEFVPEPVRDRVIAYTAMIGGGESATVEFQAPEEAGEYPFLCSFPGHYGQMNGVMVVEE